MERDPSLLLWDARRSAEALNRLRRVNPEMVSRISGVRGAVASRNLLIYGYETVDDSTVWTIVQHDVPGLAEELAALLGKERCWTRWSGSGFDGHLRVICPKLD